VIGVESIIGLVLLLATAGLMFWFSLSSARSSCRVRCGRYAALRRTRRAIGLSVEDGKRIHVSIGKASILSPNNASGLVGLNTIDRISQFSMISDRPPVDKQWRWFAGCALARHAAVDLSGWQCIRPVQPPSGPPDRSYPILLYRRNHAADAG
jgi:hypothetical protein